ncbi:MAG: hypothetical protein IKZ41_02445, partial [Clostridia bacterium]|nr:hypothetical protein [Clostridia bacterium]
AYADEFTPIVRVHPLPALQDADPKPQIFAADDPEIIDPASFSPFLDQDGTTWTEKYTKFFSNQPNLFSMENSL